MDKKEVRLIVGRIIRHEANCACGELKGLSKIGEVCPKCEGKVLDILFVTDIESDGPVDEDFAEEFLDVYEGSREKEE